MDDLQKEVDSPESKCGKAPSLSVPMSKRDGILVFLFFLCGCAIGTTYVLTWNGTQFFYQNLFGPAVMFAYGRGYVNPDVDAAPTLYDFLDVSREFNAGLPPDIDAFDKSDLPDGLPTKPLNAIQRRELYLLGSAALVWRIFGVAWSSLAPLFGLLFGASIAAAYGVFRLGMNRLVAVICTLMFMTSPIHLQYLPALRDYSKAPFILAAVFLTGLLLKNALSRRGVLVCCACCGVVIGVGLGFRVDVLACVPAFVFVLWFLLPTETTVSWHDRLAATLLFVAGFLLASWPVVTQLGSGGNKSHPAILGLMAPYSARLGVGGTAYELGHQYMDAEGLTLVNAYARHVDPQSPPLIYESPAYEQSADACLWTLVKLFPADILLRAYAAVLRVLDELHAGADRRMPPGITNRFLSGFYDVRWYAESFMLFKVRYMAVLAVVLLAAHRFRLGIGALCLIAYYAGYSAVQFGTRNCFHLELIPLWVAGFLASLALSGLTAASSAERRRWIVEKLRDAKVWAPRSAARVILLAGVSAVTVLVSLHGFRWYQDRAVKSVFEAYETAEREPVNASTSLENDRAFVQIDNAVGAAFSRRAPETSWFGVDFLVAEFRADGRPVSMTARYLSDCKDTNITWSVEVPPVTEPDAVTRVYFPVFFGVWTDYMPQWLAFRGIEIPADTSADILGVYCIKHAESFPVLLHAVLPPGWKDLPQYQRLTR